MGWVLAGLLLGTAAAAAGADDLRSQLAAAVEAEDYELAAKLKAELKRAQSPPDAFAEWRAVHRPSGYDDGEEPLRRAAFQRAADDAAANQRRNPLARFGHNSLSDLTEPELALRRGLKPPPEEGSGARHFGPAVVAAAEQRSVNYSASVSAPEDQGECSAGWAFAATGAIEGQLTTSGWPLHRLSAAELIECDWEGTDGCRGGRVDAAISWVANGGGIHRAADYEWVTPRTRAGATTPNAEAEGALCRRDDLKKQPMHKAVGVGHLSTDESQMLVVLHKIGPMAVYVRAASWPTYSGGIITDCGEGAVDHAATVVGYGRDGDVGYWVLRNSWGTGWGEGGYVRLQYGKGLCGINTAPMLAMVDMEPQAEKEFTAREEAKGPDEL